MLGFLRSLLYAAFAVVVFVANFSAGFGGAVAQAGEIEVDVSQHYLTLTTTFKGEKLIVFGVAAGGTADDLIVIVEGPSREITLYEKVKRYNIWLNQKMSSFPGVPGFWFLVSSRPLRDILSEEALSSQRIDLKGYVSRGLGEDAKNDFDSVIEEMKRRKFITEGGSVLQRNGELFRVDIQVPSDVSEGLYEVRALTVRWGKVVAVDSSSFWINKEGVTAWLTKVSHDQPLLLGIVWGIISVLLGLMFVLISRYRRQR